LNVDEYGNDRNGGEPETLDGIWLVCSTESVSAPLYSNTKLMLLMVFIRCRRLNILFTDDLGLYTHA